MNRIHLCLTALALLVTPLACGEVETPEELGYAYELVDAG